MDEKEYRRIPIVRVLLLLFLVVMLYLCFYSFIEAKFLYNVEISVLLLLFFLPLGIIDLIWFKITITDKYLSIRQIRTKKILFKEVDKIIFISNKLEIFSKKKRISITTDVENKQEAMDIVINKVRNNTSLIIYGDKDVIESYGLEATRT